MDLVRGNQSDYGYVHVHVRVLPRRQGSLGAVSDHIQVQPPPRVFDRDTCAMSFVLQAAVFRLNNNNDKKK